MLSYLVVFRKKRPFWRFFNKKPWIMSESGGERRKIQPFNRQRRVFLIKFGDFLDPTPWKLTSYEFFYPIKNVKILEPCGTPCANILRKTRSYRSLSNKPFFHLTILSYKIFNFEKSIVHILLTILTTGLDKGRAWEYWQSDLGVQGAGLQTACML